MASFWCWEFNNWFSIGLEWKYQSSPIEIWHYKFGRCSFILEFLLQYCLEALLTFYWPFRFVHCRLFSDISFFVNFFICVYMEHSIMSVMLLSHSISSMQQIIIFVAATNSRVLNCNIFERGWTRLIKFSNSSKRRKKSALSKA